MKKITVLLFTLLTFVMTNVANAQGHNFPARLFSGLWQGVDTNDGSLTERSIVCQPNGICQVLGSDRYWVFCGNLRGILSGEGFLSGNVLTIPEFTLTCNDNQRTITVGTTLTYNLFNRTLVELVDNPAISSITFHKVSR